MCSFATNVPNGTFLCLSIVDVPSYHFCIRPSQQLLIVCPGLQVPIYWVYKVHLTHNVDNLTMASQLTTVMHFSYSNTNKAPYW